MINSFMAIKWYGIENGLIIPAYYTLVENRMQAIVFIVVKLFSSS